MTSDSGFSLRRMCISKGRFCIYSCGSTSHPRRGRPRGAWPGSRRGDHRGGRPNGRLRAQPHGSLSGDDYYEIRSIYHGGRPVPAFGDDCPLLRAAEK